MFPAVIGAAASTLEEPRVFSAYIGSIVFWNKIEQSRENTPTLTIRHPIAGRNPAAPTKGYGSADLLTRDGRNDVIHPPVPTREWKYDAPDSTHGIAQNLKPEGRVQEDQLSFERIVDDLGGGSELSAVRGS
ncbi:MAG: hypothetical protein ACJ8R9_21725 [Steroidobacteraceae bacterium]